MKNKRGDLLFLLIVTLFWFAQYVLTPFLSPHLIAMGITASFAGTIIGAYGMAQLILRIPISVGEDLSGKHKLFIGAGLVVMVLSSVVPLLSPTPVAYLISRTLLGVAASTWVSYTAAFTQNSGNVKQRMGKLIAANNFGVMLSYIAGGFLYQSVGMNGLFAASIVSALAALALIFVWQPEGTPVPKAFQKDVFVKVISNKHLWNCSLLTTLGMLVLFATSNSFVSTYAQTLGASSLELSLVAIAFNAMGTLMSWAYAQGALKKLSERGQLMVAFGVMTLYCVLLPLCRAPWQVALVQLLGGMSRSIMYTLLMAIAPARVSPDAKTTAVGVFQCVYSLGMTGGPVVMGYLLDWSNQSYAFGFGMMGAVALVGVAWAMLGFKHSHN